MNMERSRGRASAAFVEPGAPGKQEILARSSLAGLPEDTRAGLLGIASAELLPRAHTISVQGEPTSHVVVIGAGRVKIERLRGTRAVLLGHRGPGHFVGETALSGVATASESATVVDDVAALAIPLAPLRQQLAADPTLSAAFAEMIVRQHRELEARLMGLLMNGVEARLAGFVLDAAGRWGRPHADGELVTAAFTHAEMALLIGSTRETVTLVLGKLKREGLLGFDRRRVVIRDRARLEQRVKAAP